MTERHLETFQDLLNASRQQPEPQRLLFVFALAGLPADATAAQRRDVENGQGGQLTPTLCVDMTPEDITDFAALVAESEQTGLHWDVMFVGSLSGRGGIAPSDDEAEQPLRLMVAAINEGRIDGLAAFNRQGEVLSFH